MKSPTPETQCTECIFQRQYPICAVNLQITPYVGQSPINLPKTICPPSAMKSFRPYFMGWNTMSFAPLENLVGVYPSIFARKCRIKLAKILNLAQRIVRQNRSASLCII